MENKLKITITYKLGDTLKEINLGEFDYNSIRENKSPMGILSLTEYMLIPYVKDLQETGQLNIIK